MSLFLSRSLSLSLFLSLSVSLSLALFPYLSLLSSLSFYIYIHVYIERERTSYGCVFLLWGISGSVTLPLTVRLDFLCILPHGPGPCIGLWPMSQALANAMTSSNLRHCRIRFVLQTQTENRKRNNSYEKDLEMQAHRGEIEGESADMQGRTRSVAAKKAKARSQRR